MLTPGIFRAESIEESLIFSCIAQDANRQSISDWKGAHGFWSLPSLPPPWSWKYARGSP